MVIDKDLIILHLREVYDPEIPVNIYDLGLIYEISIRGRDVYILMSLTSPTCPSADLLIMMIKDELEEVEGIDSVNVEITFEPKWDSSRITKEVREELGLDFNFDENLEVKKSQKVCFKCGITSDELPIVECFYDGAKTGICNKCLGKF